MSTDVRWSTGDLIRFRHRFHEMAECSGCERATAAFVADRLVEIGLNQVVSGVGGFGVVGVVEGKKPGRAVLLRADLDALPLRESNDVPHRSKNPGAHHACGHDGHMTMLLGAADRLAASPPPRGRIVLLFQPAEETGEGAARVLADSRFAGILPDWAFAVHNLPGAEEGAVVIREGCMAAGSSGFVARFIGSTAHAAHPEKARSPAAAVARVVLDLEALNSEFDGGSGISLCTVIHARVGGPAFGTTPGEAEVMATVRSDSVDVLAELKRGCEEIARKHAVAHSLGLEIDWREEFPPTFNHPEAVRLVVAAAKATGLDVKSPQHPLRWSEDFGHFTARSPGALIGLGVGRNHPPLHSPDYDFSDSLIPVGAKLLDALARCAAPRCAD